ncbi:MAG: ABC transporter ATP-binding protein [Rhodospirillales bacterium]|nr:ABC transporter ATP-binding protein [Rhodospirillales bacterium]
MAIDQAPLVEVAGLRVVAGRDGAGSVIVDDVSFTIGRGEVVALIGESGSGKTTIALALMGHARAGCAITGGRVRVGATEPATLAPAALSRFRGRTVSYIAQSAAAAFNPSQRIMAQVIENVLIHRLMQRKAAEEKARALFRALALPDPDGVGALFPHQVSGGQLQRLLAAMALITEPDLVILDEPTTALDVTTQIEVLRAFRSVVRERGTTALYVSHDLAVVAQMADRIIVLRDGRIQEAAPAGQLLGAPAHPYTRTLLAAAAPAPRGAASAPAHGAVPLLEVSGLVAGYGPRGGDGMPAMPVLRDIGFTIMPGSVLGVVGESGCGKSTLAQVVAGLLPAARGTIALNGEPLAPQAAARSRAQLQRVQIVFQMADMALNPAHSVERILARPLQFYHGLRGAALSRRIAALLDMVRLSASLAGRPPAGLSGGQKQRLNLARALAAEPALILCDEVTSALDTVVGAAILDLLSELRRELGVAYMFISHDLATVRAICDQVMILYAGRNVERGGQQVMQRSPRHPYTDLLLSSVPELRQGWLDGISATHLAEAAGGLTRAAAGLACPFYERCAVRLDTVCDRVAPPLRHLSKGAAILCHRSEAELLHAQSSGGAASGHSVPLHASAE